MQVVQRAARVGIVAVVGAATLGVAAPAFATAQTGSAAGLTFDLGPSPTGLPASCSFANGDANFVFLSGNTVSHESSNKNGDWGGGTAEGTAVFYEDTTQVAVGHLTIWDGGGNNAHSQTEGGLTLNFSSSSVSIHVNAHQTTNASGTPTANALNIKVACS
jgi:hypothetical protein